MKKNKKRILPVWVMISFIITLILVAVSFIAPGSQMLADFVNTYIATPIRVGTAFITDFIPFSLFEAILILLIPLIIFLTVVLVRRAHGPRAFFRGVVSFLGVISIMLSGYLAVMAIPYHTTPISEHLSIDGGEVGGDEIYRAALIARDTVNEILGDIPGDGVTDFPYSREELSGKISDAYKNIADRYGFFYAFDSKYKEIHHSGLMSDMGIAGIYTYFTGEANLNTLYPDYDTAFSVAHEFAHQRGINRENEANFMAFLVLSETDDKYLRYSAYLNIYEYLASALYKTDKDLYFEVRDSLDARASADIARSQAITREHQESPLFELMNKVNDAYLKSNGTEGVVTYGYVARLATRYLLSRNAE